MRYIIPQELKSSTKLNKFLYVTDLFFIIAYFAVMMLFKNLVHEKLQIVYYIFNVVVAIILTVQTPFNPQKRIWQSIYFFLLKDKTVYKPINIPKDKALCSNEHKVGGKYGK